MLQWPSARVAEGDWTPCQYYDGALAALSRELESLRGVKPLGEMALVEPGGQRLHDAFENPLGDRHQSSPDYDVVWTHKTDKRTTMQSLADYRTSPKVAKRNYATEVLWPKASRMLVACKVRGSKIRVTAIHLPMPALGQPFIPVTPLEHIKSPHETLKAWCAYLNSTPAALSFLNRRQKTLDYSTYSLDQLRSIPVPDPASVDLTPLVDAFERLSRSEMLPWPRMPECPIRAEIDKAVATVLGLDPARLAEWRERIAAEPTVSNKPATS